MISETSKYLSKLYHLMLNERERDDSILPLDLWKSNVSTVVWKFMVCVGHSVQWLDIPLYKPYISSLCDLKFSKGSSMLVSCVY